MGCTFVAIKRPRKGQARKVGIQDAPMDSTPWSTRNIGSPATTPKGGNKYTVRLMLSHLPSAKCPTKATWSCLEPSLLSIIWRKENRLNSSVNSSHSRLQPSKAGIPDNPGSRPPRDPSAPATTLSRVIFILQSQPRPRPELSLSFNNIHGLV